MGRYAKTIGKIDLANGTFSRADVSETPVDLCVDSARERLFVVNDTSSQVTEYRTSDLGLVRTIPWAGSAGANGFAQPRIYCTPDRLYMNDGNVRPVLYTVEGLDGASPVVSSRGISNVGMLTFNAAHSYLYYWYRYGPAISTTLHRVLTATFTEDYATDPDPAFMMDPPDTPIFLDEPRSLLLVNSRVVNLGNLSTVLRELPDNSSFVGGSTADICAYDPVRGLVASQAYVFTVDDLEVVAPRLLSYSRSSFFDQNGLLWSLAEEKIQQVLVAQKIPAGW